MLDVSMNIYTNKMVDVPVSVTLRFLNFLANYLKEQSVWSPTNLYTEKNVFPWSYIIENIYEMFWI